jgi:hypothetical protein
MTATPFYRLVLGAGHHVRRHLAASSAGLVVVALFGGCGTDHASATAPDATTDAVAPSAALQMPDVALTPGLETTRCVVLQLTNDTPQMLRRIHSVISRGSHHLIAYRVPDTTALQGVPTPCEAFQDITNGVSPVIIAESADADVVYPDGVGLPIAAHQKIKLEEHFLNPGDATIAANGKVEFTLVDPTPSMVQANLMFWGPQQFSIDPHKTGAADFAHEVLAGVKVFGLTTHEHRFGTLATIDLATSSTGTATELYRNTDWEHPPLKTFAPPLAFDGSQSLRLHCEWFNSSSNPVAFGLSAATNEMCFFWAYYYPSQGFQQCIEEGCQTQ